MFKPLQYFCGACAEGQVILRGAGVATVSGLRKLLGARAGGGGRRDGERASNGRACWGGGATAERLRKPSSARAGGRGGATTSGL